MKSIKSLKLVELRRREGRTGRGSAGSISCSRASGAYLLYWWHTLPKNIARASTQAIPQIRNRPQKLLRESRESSACSDWVEQPSCESHLSWILWSSPFSESWSMAVDMSTARGESLWNALGRGGGNRRMIFRLDWLNSFKIRPWKNRIKLKINRFMYCFEIWIINSYSNQAELRTKGKFSECKIAHVSTRKTCLCPCWKPCHFILEGWIKLNGTLSQWGGKVIGMAQSEVADGGGSSNPTLPYQGSMIPTFRPWTPLKFMCPDPCWRVRV